MCREVTSTAKSVTPKKATKKAPAKTHATHVSVPTYVAAVENDTRRADADMLL